MQSRVRRAAQFAAAPARRAQYGPMGRALYVESVAHAVSVAGGCERLAALLGVSTREVERWCAGALPEPGAFLRLIEILTDPAAPRD